MKKDLNDVNMHRKMYAYRSRSVTATSEYWKGRQKDDAHTDGSAAKGKRDNTKAGRAEARPARETRRPEVRVLQAKSHVRTTVTRTSTTGFSGDE